MGALIGTTLLTMACTSRKAAAEAETAASFEQPGESQPSAAAASPAPAAAQEEAPATTESAPAAAGEDETWTDDDTSASSAATAPPAQANQPETRTMEIIRQFVLDRREKVRPCYDAAQAGRPNFKGDVMMRFVLSPSGSVQSIEYSEKESTLYAPDVGACIAKEMKTWQFPASSRGMETKVGYPFNFNPRKK